MREEVMLLYLHHLSYHCLFYDHHHNHHHYHHAVGNEDFSASDLLTSPHDLRKASRYHAVHVCHGMWVMVRL